MVSMSSLVRSSIPLDIRTSHGTWSLSNETKYYTKMSPKSFSNLPAPLQSEIIRQQWETGRGLVFELEDLMKLTGKSRHSFTAISLADSKQIILLHLPVWESFIESFSSKLRSSLGT
jgi:hypothetical protein